MLFCSYIFLALCYFVLIFFLPCVILFLYFFSLLSIWEERANFSTFRTFVRFALVWFYLFPFPLCVWDGWRLVIVALDFSLTFFVIIIIYMPSMYMYCIIIAFGTPCTQLESDQSCIIL